MKNILARFVIGFVIGVFVGFTIILIMSHKYEYNMDLTSYTYTYFTCGILGSVYTVASLIYQKDEWSLIKQTSVHLAITTPFLFMIGWLNGWLQISTISISIFIVIAILIYIIAWIGLYFYWKEEIKKINEELRKQDH